MPKINGLLLGLLVAAIGILIVLSAYEIFLKPSEEIPSQVVSPINSYYGEDVLDFIKQ